MTSRDLADLRWARDLLETPRLAMRLVEWSGKPLEFLLRHLPGPLAWFIRYPVQKALTHALRVAVIGLPADDRPGAARRHRFAAVASGAAGGFFGLPALPWELPVSTVILLRAIADIARSEGEDIRNMEGRLACLSVFALGAGKDAGPSESAYFAVRAAISREVVKAAEYLSVRGLAEESAPALLQFLTRIGARYGLVVSEKLVLQFLPLIGALLGGGVNWIFARHFQETARGHFIIRRLERRYGEAVVRRAYLNLSSGNRKYG
ncbi:MAG: peptidase [Desulfobacterales bacterium]|nr:MAG: peptidase [Desulfobacterales bacterium]